MAFDQPTRNRLLPFVGDSRSILTEEFTRQMQNEYGLDPVSGAVTPLENLRRLDDARLETARVLRDPLAHYSASSPSSAVSEILQRIAREQAFTVLNRLAALRMAEARGILIESLANGYNSKGFQLYARLAGTGLGETGDSYRCYLFSVFDEFALDLKSLFDRFSPYGRLFPREAALLELLKLINDPEIAPLWAEDETIGWIYQYFNSKEERKKMRDESSAPRNSRELAVRNQFFTPRYVVEFLTDNTLGRIWYEMTKGETRLKDQCRYLVRRPNEIFLKDGEASPGEHDVHAGETPPDDHAGKMPAFPALRQHRVLMNAKRLGTPASCRHDHDLDPSQEDLLKQPVYIPHRPIKDPREIRVLDPACGSMHFGLYAFDLLEAIYEEAWDLEETMGTNALERSSNLKSLHDAYDDKTALLREVPRLIIEHNLHGIDIDPRAVQIAGLSLWLRAHRAWLMQGIKAADRPQIRRSNIVCAEPMPGEEKFLSEFIDKHFSAAPELRLLGQLVRHVFESMKLAGEAGSLLKIEEEIAGAVAEAKKKWLEGPKMEQDFLFADMAKPKQMELGFDVSGITDETFWEKAEERIYAALRDYAEHAESGGGYQRRLFADDAVRGFAFIDICRKRYDVVLMNPPFGDLPVKAVSYLESHYPHISDNLLCAFIERARINIRSDGFYGVIFDRTAAIKSSYKDFRRSKICGRIVAVADTGWGVLDANVETTVHVLKYDDSSVVGAFFDVLNILSDQKADKILSLVCHINEGMEEKSAYLRNSEDFIHLPNSVVGYYFEDFVLNLFNSWPSLESQSIQARQGHSLVKTEHKRLFWEVPSRSSIGKNKKYCVLYNGGDFSLFYSPYRELTVYGSNADLIASHPSVALRNLGYQFSSGIGYGKRGEYLDAHVLRAESVFTDEGQSITGLTPDTSLLVLAFLNSILAQMVINTYCGQHKHAGYVNLLPFPTLEQNTANKVRENARAIINLKLFWSQQDETCTEFTSPIFSKIELDRDRGIKTLIQRIVSRLEKDRRELGQHLDFNDDIFLSVAKITNQEMNGFATRRALRPIDSPWPDIDTDLGGQNELCLFATEILSQIIGMIFGRWDIRFATGERAAPELPDPFAPLPVCPPGMLQNSNGLPAEPADVPSDYPLRISWPGIIVDDKGHPEDIEQRLQETLAVIWKDRADAIEQEACEILGVQDLREYFRKPAGFFADHLKRYSKSRRQAPIYWPLSTPSGSYTLWLYYHRLNDQTLFTCVNDFVEPKLRQVGAAANDLRAKGGNRTRAEEKEYEKLQEFELELTAFRDELLRLAKLPWRPNLNDGVQITAAPLWGLFRLTKWQKTLKETWQKLEKGEYDWAHIAYTLWPNRVRVKCKTDKSLAIAHGLEELYQEPPASAKKKRGRKIVNHEDHEDYV